MKKTIVALVLLAAASGQAADVVYSANIVGFTKMTVEKGSRTIVGIPFNNGEGQTPSSVFGDQLPVGTKLYAKPKGESYQIETYKSTSSGPPSFTITTGWTPDTAVLDAGVGYWLEIPADAANDNYEVVFSGNVADATDALTVSEGVNLIAYPYPVDMVWTNTALAKAAVVGDKLFSWTGTGYSINTYTEESSGPPSFTVTTGWSNPDLILNVSKGFWYTTSSQSVEDVIEPLPYEL